MRKLLSAGIIREFEFDTEEEKDSYKNFLVSGSKDYVILHEGSTRDKDEPEEAAKPWLVVEMQYNNNPLYGIED